MKFARTFGFALALAAMLFVTAVVGLCSDAGAQPNPPPPSIPDVPKGNLCKWFSEMELFLRKSWNEELQWGGSYDKNVLLFYLSEAGTFSIVETDSVGHACIVRDGMGWQSLRFNRDDRKLGAR